MTDLSIFDTPAADIKMPRNAPAGKYIATLTNYKIAEKPNEKGNWRVSLEFRVEAPLEGQDLEGVNLKKPYFATQWVGTSTLGYIKRDMSNLIGAAVETGTPKDWYEQARGRAAQIKLRVDEYAKKNNRDEMEVESFTAAG